MTTTEGQYTAQQPTIQEETTGRNPTNDEYTFTWHRCREIFHMSVMMARGPLFPSTCAIGLQMKIRQS
jgi:hypothetical protein